MMWSAFFGSFMATLAALVVALLIARLAITQVFRRRRREFERQINQARKQRSDSSAEVQNEAVGSSQGYGFF